MKCKVETYIDTLYLDRESVLEKGREFAKQLK